MSKAWINKAIVAITLGTWGMAACAQPNPPRQMENLGRGVVAVKQDDGKVFVGWRMLGTDAESIAFNVYRSSGGASVKLNTAPLTGATHFLDSSLRPDQPVSYFVRSVEGGKEGAASAAFTLPANAPARPYLSIPLKTPDAVKTPTGDAAYTPNDVSVGDLDGDGEYEIILHQAGRSRDNSHDGETNPPILQAYKLDGTLLWSINLGRNIREGAHYTQFMVYDLDGDGRAEIVCKTADGTTDGAGKVIGDANANYVNKNGRILSGPEFLTIFDGLTGKALVTTDYIPSRLPEDPKNFNPTSDQLKAVWGDGYGNRPDRFLACIAYLDGVHPSVVMCRGYYSRTFLVAWDWRAGKLTRRWVFDSNAPGNEKFAGQGNHNLSVADVDGDGKDEIIYGKMAVDDDGKGLYTTGIGHGDAIHVSDLDPSRPGLEVFSIQEPFRDSGAHMFDARTGEILWKKASVKAGEDGEGPGRGLALDVDPRYPGFESWVAGAGLGGQMWDAKGNKIADKTPSVNFGIYWDGDLLSELLDSTRVSKWDWEKGVANTLLDAKKYDCVSNNGTKSTPCLSADILGDWREEVIYHTEDNKELRIFTTTIPTEYRFRTFMHDPEYRLSIAWQNVGYNQPPHTDFYIGPDMKMPPRPNIVLVGAKAPAQAAVTPVGPRVFLIGDSTVNNGTKGQMGWGKPIKALFDDSKITVENRARGGRSSRTFFTEGLWDAVLKDLKPGDYVLMQFGHNDGGKPEGVYPQGRASLKGNGEETREVETKPGTKEVVHSYGWYLRRYIADAKTKGATPIVLSMVPRNDWRDGKVLRASGGYGLWAKEAAEQGGALFLDLNEIVARHYEALGQEKVAGYFPNEHTHTNGEGAQLNAESVVEGLKALPGQPLTPFLKK